MRVIDLERWPRRSRYEFFRGEHLGRFYTALQERLERIG